MTTTSGLSAREVIRAWASQPQRGVIFDFNGTPSDDEPILLEIFTALFAAHLGWDMPPSEYHGRLAGRSDREIIQTYPRENRTRRASPGGARALGLRPGQVLVFEDSVHGVRAATAAGMHCVAVTGTRGGTRLAEVTSALVPRLDASLLDL